MNHCKTQEAPDKSTLATFPLKYVEQVNVLLAIAKSNHSGNFERINYIDALGQVKYFFSRDLLNYARLMPLHLSELSKIKSKDAGLWKAFSSGEFVVNKSGIPFTNLPSGPLRCFNKENPEYIISMWIAGEMAKPDKGPISCKVIFHVNIIINSDTSIIK